jgi:hypothetical protein
MLDNEEFTFCRDLLASVDLAVSLVPSLLEVF